VSTPFGKAWRSLKTCNTPIKSLHTADNNKRKPGCGNASMLASNKTSELRPMCNPCCLNFRRKWFQAKCQLLLLQDNCWLLIKQLVFPRI